MTHEEIKAVQELQGTKGFRVIEYFANLRLEELKDVDNLDETSATPIQTQALGRKYAAKYIKELLSDLQLNSNTNKEQRKTYE